MSATAATEKVESEAPKTAPETTEAKAAEAVPEKVEEGAADDVDEEEEEQTNLIVNYLPQHVSEDRLRELFAPFGELVHVKLMLDKVTQSSMGYGFVKFAKPESAAAAITAMNGRQMDQKKLRVGYSHPRTEANVYVGNLKPSVTKEQLEELFKRYGPIIECKILVDRDTGVSKGCGFVKFENVNHAKDAIAGSSGAELPDISLRPLTVKFARKHEKPHHGHFSGGMQRQQPTRYRPAPSTGAGGRTPAGEFTGYCLFVYNLPPETTNDYLRTLFQRFGTITSANAMLDYNGSCRGFGFVNFATIEEAEKAIKEMNGFVVKNRSLKVSFKNEKRH